MILKKFEFTEKSEENITWKIKNLNLGNKNLIVGKNAVGKTRTLVFILDFVKLLFASPLLRKGTFEWKVVFDDNGNNIEYYIKLKNDKIIEEILKRNNENFLKRNENGDCSIYSEMIKKHVSFIPP